MKIVVLVQDFYPNISGGALTRWHFSQLVAERDHDIVVFTPRRENTSKRETIAGVEIRRPFPLQPDYLPGYTTFAAVFRILSSMILCVYLLIWLRGRDVDGLHSVSNSTHWIAKIVGAVYRIPVITFFGYTPAIHRSNAPFIKSILESLNFRLFMGDIVLCRTPETQEAIEKVVDVPTYQVHGILDSETVRQVADTVDTVAIRESYGILPDDQLLVFVGRLVPIKNPLGAIDIVLELPEKYKLIIVGDGPLRGHVEERIQELDLGHRAKTVGELSHVETLKIVAASDGMLVTSQAESYSAAALEGLALDCSVYATPVGILPDLDYSNLHIGNREEIPGLIKRDPPDGKFELNDELINSMSIERYTDTILDVVSGVKKS